MLKLPSPKKKYRWKQDATKHKRIQHRESEIRNTGKKHEKFSASTGEWDIRKTIPNINRDIQKETSRQTEITNGEMQHQKEMREAMEKMMSVMVEMNHANFYV